MGIRQQLQAAFLDYTNNYLTVATYAEHNGLTIEQANALILLGRSVHEGLVSGFGQPRALPEGQVLDQLRRQAAEKFVTESDLNGYQVVDGNGWESTQREDSLQKVLFVEDETADNAPSVRKVVTVTFLEGTATLAHANIDGEVLDVPALPEATIQAIRAADPVVGRDALAGNGNGGRFTGNEEGGVDDLDR